LSVLPIILLIRFAIFYS